MKVGLAWKITAYILLGVLLIWTLGPFYWMLITSFKPNAEMYLPQPTLWPRAIVLDHYLDVFTRSYFPIFFRNSLTIAITTTLASLVIGSLAAYAITRLDFRGRRQAARSLVISYLVPPAVLFIPLYAVLYTFGLLDSIGGLMVAYLTFTVPFCTWLLLGYFQTVPKELEEAALVDGCSRIGTLIRIILPLSAPALVVVTLFSFTLSWNEFLYAMVFSTSKETMTVTAGLAYMQAEDVFFWGMMMAISLVIAIPPVLLYLVAQRWLVGGLTIGGVKG